MKFHVCHQVKISANMNCIPLAGAPLSINGIIIDDAPF